jgi:nitrogen PTS system EIIA component
LIHTVCEPDFHTCNIIVNQASIRGLTDSKNNKVWLVMRVIDLVDPAVVLVAAKASSRKVLVKQLAEKGAARWGFKASDIVAAVEQREKGGTTAFGGGVAIPHAKLDYKGRAFAAFAVLDTPVDFAALDNQPVDIVCLLIAPQSPPTEHLRALASVSRLLRDRSLLAKLRGCKSADALMALLDSWDSLQAA